MPIPRTDLPAALRGLYAITPDEPDESRLLGMAASALAGGAALQFRDKTTRRRASPAPGERHAEPVPAIRRLLHRQ